MASSTKYKVPDSLVLNLSLFKNSLILSSKFIIKNKDILLKYPNKDFPVSHIKGLIKLASDILNDDSDYFKSLLNFIGAGKPIGHNKPLSDLPTKPGHAYVFYNYEWLEYNSIRFKGRPDKGIKDGLDLMKLQFFNKYGIDSILLSEFLSYFIDEETKYLNEEISKRDSQIRHLRELLTTATAREIRACNERNELKGRISTARNAFEARQAEIRMRNVASLTDKTSGGRRSTRRIKK